MYGALPPTASGIGGAGGAADQHAVESNQPSGEHGGDALTVEDSASPRRKWSEWVAEQHRVVRTDSDSIRSVIQVLLEVESAARLLAFGNADIRVGVAKEEEEEIGGEGGNGGEGGKGEAGEQEKQEQARRGTGDY